MRKSRPRPEANSAREIAFEILLRVKSAGAYASILLDSWERGLHDRREIGLLHELVLGVLRRQAILDHLLATLSSRPPEKMDREVRTALRIGCYSLLYLDRVPDFAAVDSAVELVKRAGMPSSGSFVNGVLRAISARGRSLLPPPPAEGDVDGLALYHSHPAWWVRRLHRRFGWRAAWEILESNNAPAETVLHPNTRRIGAAELLAMLRKDGVEAHRGRVLPQAIRLRGGRPSGGKILRAGLAWVQDEAAQIVPHLFGEKLGPRTADLCAAPGGKTMQLAARIPQGGLLVAVDRHAGRLRRLRSNAARTGTGGLVIVNADMTTARPPFKTTFDQLLVDAPCSGSGTLRRHPEIRWRLREEEFEPLARRQGLLLDTAARLVAPGGVVVYAVCSVEREEGEEVVENFLRRHDRFKLADPRPVLPESARSLVDENRFLQTWPEAVGVDGFFGARLVYSA